jgi:hypothetical protein
MSIMIISLAGGLRFPFIFYFYDFYSMDRNPLFCLLPRCLVYFMLRQYPFLSIYTSIIEYFVLWYTFKIAYVICPGCFYWLVFVASS